MNSVFVVLTAILSSGVIAALVSASFTDTKERWVFRRQKIEELYLSAAKWLREVDNHYLLYFRVVKGQLTYNQALDSSLKESGTAKDIGELHLKMQMNIAMYEPSLIPHLRVLENEQKKMNHLLSMVRDMYSETGEATDLFDSYSVQIIRFGDAGDKLKEEIVRRGSVIASEPTQVVVVFRWMRDIILRVHINTHVRLDNTRKWLGTTWPKLDHGNPPSHTTDPNQVDRCKR